MLRSRAFDVDEFVRLYRAYGDTWSWPQYAAALSTHGEKPVAVNTVREFVSRNRVELAREYGIIIPPRQVSGKRKYIPWPLDYRELKNAYLYRYLQNCARVEEFGIEALSLEKGTRWTWSQLNTRLTKERKVIRYDPGRGLWEDDARGGETPGGPENMKYFYQRHPETLPESSADPAG